MYMEFLRINPQSLLFFFNFHILTNSCTIVSQNCHSGFAQNIHHCFCVNYRYLKRGDNLRSWRTIVIHQNMDKQTNAQICLCY